VKRGCEVRGQLEFPNDIIGNARSGCRGGEPFRGTRPGVRLLIERLGLGCLLWPVRPGFRTALTKCSKPAEKTAVVELEPARYLTFECGKEQPSSVVDIRGECSNWRCGRAFSEMSFRIAVFVQGKVLAPNLGSRCVGQACGLPHRVSPAVRSTGTACSRFEAGIERLWAGKSGIKTGCGIAAWNRPRSANGPVLYRTGDRGIAFSAI